MKYLYLILLITITVSCNNLKPETTPAESESPTIVEVTSNSRKSNSNRLAAGAKKFMRNKKINNTTKGAVIGGIVGGVTGALVSKNKPGQGIIVGTVIGAGAGALTGKAIDNKQRNGRIFKNGLFGRRENRD